MNVLSTQRSRLSFRRSVCIPNTCHACLAQQWLCPHPHCSLYSQPWLRQPQALLFCFPSDVLRFDNTYSYMHAKKVSFTVEVLLPDKASEEKMKQLGAASK